MFRTVTSRITLWYTAIFGLLSLFVFGLVNLAVVTRLRARMDAELGNESREFEEIYRRGGIEALREGFRLEGESDGYKRVFFRFFSPAGDRLLSSDIGSWGELGGLPAAASALPPGRAILCTPAAPGLARRARAIYRKTGDGHVIEIGATTEDDDDLVRGVHRVFGSALLVMLLCGGAAGYGIARRAMRGVTRVTDTAVRIGKGDLARRVAPGGEGIEIARLALAFNEMLGRIQALVEEMRGVADNIAHDLRTPITRIRMTAETALGGAQKPDEYRHAAGIVIEECERMAQMINTMLEIAKADSGAIVLSRETVDLVALAADACDLFLPAAEEKGIALRAPAPRPPLPVSGDAGRLRSMMGNLLDNAVKFTPPGGEIVLEAREARTHAVLIVRDTGTGIDAGDLPRVFDRFYRADRSRSMPGNGLGLSFAAAIARAHGGEITAESRPGMGSAFTIRLPLITKK